MRYVYVFKCGFGAQKLNGVNISIISMLHVLYHSNQGSVGGSVWTGSKTRQMDRVSTMERREGKSARRGEKEEVGDGSCGQ